MTQAIYELLLHAIMWNGKFLPSFVVVGKFVKVNKWVRAGICHMTLFENDRASARNRASVRYRAHE